MEKDVKDCEERRDRMADDFVTHATEFVLFSYDDFRVSRTWAKLQSVYRSEFKSRIDPMTMIELKKSSSIYGYLLSYFGDAWLRGFFKTQLAVTSWT